MPGQREDLVATAEELARVAAGRPEAARASRLAERLRSGRFVISVAGEFKRGKSTLVNALLGDEVLPAGVLPLTAIPTEVRFGDAAVVVEHLDGRRVKVDRAAIADFVTEARNPANERAVAHVEVQGRWPLLAAGAVIVDTPGIGSVHEHNTEVARDALRDADGAVLVLSADAPVSEQERDLVRSLSERRAPTFFVLNKVDHLRAAELEEVRRFVEQVLCDELGRKPSLFALSARAALEDPSSSGAGEFEDFVAELERFIQDDLVDARLASARRELARLGASLRDALTVEAAALDLDAETLATRLAEFLSAADVERRAFDDDRTLLARDVARLVDDVTARLYEFARAAPARYEPTLREVAATAPRAHLAASLWEVVERAVRASFEELRVAEADRAEQSWEQLAGRFRARTQARIDAVRDAAGGLFSVSLPRWDLPAVAEQREQFFYLFLHVTLTEPFGGLFARLVPSSIIRRRAAVWATEELAREFDKHAGRARWDLAQRLDGVRHRFEAAMHAELDAAVEAIVSAADRADQLHRAAVDERDRHAADAKGQRTLTDRLAALGEDPR